MVTISWVMCPSCGESEAGFTIRAESARLPWYCARCLGVELAADLRGEEHAEWNVYRLLFSAERVAGGKPPEGGGR